MSRPAPEGLWIRRLPLIAGILGGSLLLVNRLVFTPELINSQSRADALGVILSALLILTGLLWQQIQPLPPAATELQGDYQLRFRGEFTASQRLELGWSSHTLLELTAARSLLILWQGTEILRRGTFPGADSTLHPGSIVTRVQQTQRPVYLVDLKLFPARSEFTEVFPENTQAILCQPLQEHGVLLLGADTPRSFSPRDQAWIAALAEKLAQALSMAEESSATVTST
ncbi:MAG: cofactor assembly of complex C subunit B [Synechococcaceae cyanobacterium SM2_3_1]|nr:cofactor assembly of complex C subunit B [Synechococcaceae cyanobacterium SM2_3_1]